MQHRTLGIMVLALSVLLFARRLIRSFFSPLRSVPGPLLARFTDAWYFSNVREGHFEKTNLDLHRKYGALVRYGPNRHSINDPEAVKIIYSLGTTFPKSPWYTGWSSPGQWSLFSDQSVPRHAQTRRLYQATYSMSAMVQYEHFVDQCSDLFAQRLAEIAKAGQPVDLRHWFQCYAFDVIGMITYGKRLGFLDKGDDVGGVICALEDHLAYATLIGIYPSLHRHLFALKNFWAGAKGAGRAYVLRFTQEKIREGQKAVKAVPEEDAAVQDFLSKFLAKHSVEPETFTAQHVLAGCVSNMVAGSDTTAISLSAVLYYLLKNPVCLQRLRDEIDRLTAEGGLSRSVTWKETQAMPYLQAVFKEALRLHPATGLPLERVVPPGGATISGHFFPEGTFVGINTWVAHRDHRIFGPDCEQFRPERWLDEKQPEKVALMNRYWMPFGLGSRTCIGRHVSMLEMAKVIPRLVRDFDFTLDETLQGSSEWHTENYWFVKPVDFRASIRLR